MTYVCINKVTLRPQPFEMRCCGVHRYLQTFNEGAATSVSGASALPVTVK